MVGLRLGDFAGRSSVGRSRLNGHLARILGASRVVACRRRTELGDVSDKWGQQATGRWRSSNSCRHSDDEMRAITAGLRYC